MTSNHKTRETAGSAEENKHIKHTKNKGNKQKTNGKKQQQQQQQQQQQNKNQQPKHQTYDHSHQLWKIQPQPNWYDTANLPPLPEPATKKPTLLTQETIDTLKKRGDLVLKLISDQFAISIQPTAKLKQQRKDSSATASDRPSNLHLSTYSGLSESDKAFIHRILTDGTSSDKLSALTLLVSSAPLHSRAHLSNLLNLAKKNNREQAGRTIRALVEWLRGAGNPDSGGLPSNRKLKFFRDQPALPIIAPRLLPAGTNTSKSNTKLDHHARMEFDEWLALWAFEDWFKNWYLDLLRVVETMSHDSLLFTRTQSISHIHHMLNDKPEQEQNLLTLLVNKLGDREKMICSRTSHHLLQLLQVHPRMKSIVVREISNLVLKPIVVQPTNTSTPKPLDPKNNSSDHHLIMLRHHDHARYYGSITLNQIPLSKDDLEVSNRLIQVYFELFNDILGKAKIKEEQDQKEHEESKEKGEDELEAEDSKPTSSKESQKGKTCHRSKQVDESKRLSKKQILKLKEEEEALAEKNSRLVAGILTGLNRALPYGAIESSILEGYFETLFRISHTGLFNVSIQALILIQNLLKKSKPSMSDRFYRTLYSTLIDHRLLSSTSKHTLYLNLLFKSVNSDQHLPRILAFVKRIFQILPYHQPPFICSTLVLLGHLFATKPSCRQLILKGPATSSADESKGEQGEISHEEQEEYDGKKRDPRYAHAESSTLWELVPLVCHYHPSVKLNAIQLMNGGEITSSIDLEHHTLSNFLDKFVYRQPKKTQSQKGSAIMQPKLHLRVADVNKIPHKSNSDHVDGSHGPVNSKAFLERDEQQIPPDEVFFHKFFKKKDMSEEKNQKKRKEKESKSKKSKLTEDKDFGGRGGSDDGSEESDEEEEEVWEAMKRTMDKEMKDEIMDDLSEEDAWSGIEQADNQSDSDDERLAELLKEDDSSEEGDDNQVEFSNEEIDVTLSSGDENQVELSDDEIDVMSSNGIPHSDKKRKKLSSHSKDQKRRKTLKALPTFASVDQFSHLLSDDD